VESSVHVGRETTGLESELRVASESEWGVRWGAEMDAWLGLNFEQDNPGVAEGQGLSSPFVSQMSGTDSRTCSGQDFEQSPR
jgi:hypothetical protein